MADTPALPRRVRPSAGETAERYVHRLAEANHLRPTYLRQFLTTPPNSLGPIQLEKLAALTGRDPANLVRALSDLAPRTRTPGRTRENEPRKTQNQQRRRELFAAIREDARLGMSIRSLATKHHVGRRTVGKALQSETPPHARRSSGSRPCSMGSANTSTRCWRPTRESTCPYGSIPADAPT